ncbi:M23 family metallopeptidase [Pseudoglutamicibacter albus]|uniref:M23 family metallopeptidase n=1 Tax=Pseudoglutamicibacter albus TaxID=98671 RepID=UPI003305D518
MLRGFEAPEHAWSAGSRGVQLKAAAGDAVVAPADGVVSFAGKVAGRPVVAIQLPSGWRTTVEPVDASVRKGDRVTAGERIGTVATGGPCDQRCVHWGLKQVAGPTSYTRTLERCCLNSLRFYGRMLTPLQGLSHKNYEGLDVSPATVERVHFRGSSEFWV